MTLAAAGLAAVAAWLALRPSRRASAGLPLVRRAFTAMRVRVQARRHRTRQRQATRDALAEVVADVRAGQPPGRALERALNGRGIAPRTVATLRWGGDVVDSLRDDSRSTSQPLLAAAAACWSVATAQGAGLADALDRLVTQDRRAEEVRRQLGAHLAAPRATARMLALLPALGVVLGIAVGADPIGWLTGTSLGRACLVLGVGFAGIGLTWANRIAARTERLL